VVHLPCQARRKFQETRQAEMAAAVCMWEAAAHSPCKAEQFPGTMQAEAALTMAAGCMWEAAAHLPCKAEQFPGTMQAEAALTMAAGCMWEARVVLLPGIRQEAATAAVCMLTAETSPRQAARQSSALTMMP